MVVQNPDVQVNLAGGSQLTTVDYLMVEFCRTVIASTLTLMSLLIKAQQQRTRAMGFLKELFNKVDCIITPGE